MKVTNPYVLGPLSAVGIKQASRVGSYNPCIACDRDVTGHLSILWDITNGDVYSQDTPQEVLEELSIEPFPIGPDCLAKVRRFYPNA